MLNHGKSVFERVVVVLGLHPKTVMQIQFPLFAECSQ